MTDMAQVTRKFGTRVGAAVASAAVIAGAGLAASSGTAGADPEGQPVHYTVTTAAPYEFTITYLVNQPPSKEAFNADADAFLKRDKITVAPDAPWVFDTNLADPQWAFLQVSSTQRGGMGAPNARCEVTVDGQVAAQHEDPYSPMCLLSKW